MKKIIGETIYVLVIAVFGMAVGHVMAMKGVRQCESCACKRNAVHIDDTNEALPMQQFTTITTLGP